MFIAQGGDSQLVKIQPGDIISFSVQKNAIMIHRPELGMGKDDALYWGTDTPAETELWLGTRGSLGTSELTELFNSVALMIAATHGFTLQEMVWNNPSYKFVEHPDLE